MNELDLIEKAKQGDKEAFCTLYGLYKDRLFKYAYYKLGSREDALDAVSDCIVCAFENINKLKKPQAFIAWLFKILYSSCAKYVKRQITARENSNIDDYADSKEISVILDSSPLELKEALSILNSDERDIVLLCVVGGLTSKETARLTNLTAGSVRSKLSRSLKKMRNFLE